MKRILAALAAATFAGLGALVGAPASATPSTPPGPSFETCANLKGWYVNPDETLRRPVVTEAGLKFVGNDLVHHGATGSVSDLAPGSFVASPAPDQPSFFSVEVRNGDGSGYATLRWNNSTSKWNMVTGGTFYENASAAVLVTLPEPDKSSSLLSFGVGYTNSPPGTVDTVVSSVTFRGVKYDLTCKPKPSASASASQSATAAPSASTTPVANPGLPVTGAPVPFVIGAGIVLVALGVGAVVLSRRRNNIQTEA